LYILFTFISCSNSIIAFCQFDFFKIHADWLVFGTKVFFHKFNIIDFFLVPKRAGAEIVIGGENLSTPNQTPKNLNLQLSSFCSLFNLALQRITLIYLLTMETVTA